MACNTSLISARNGLKSLCTTVEMHHQLQYLNISVESNYFKTSNCIPGTTAQAKSSYLKRGQITSTELFPILSGCQEDSYPNSLRKKISTCINLKIQRCKERQNHRTVQIVSSNPTVQAASRTAGCSGQVVQASFDTSKGKDSTTSLGNCAKVWSCSCWIIFFFYV